MPLLDRMHRAGVRLVAGTDAGIIPEKPHDALPHGVQVLAHAGLTNVEALRAATSLAAAACGIADRKGALASGRDADILAVGGDPLSDLKALHDVRAVFRAGVRSARQTPDVGLDRMAPAPATE
jgi:imidazolonepropionase-like amidohydrolase